MNSTRNDIATGLFVGGVIGLTIGAFYRLLLMAIGLPRALITLFTQPSRRFHFMYYPSAALTIVALTLVFYVGVYRNPWTILYGLFIGWIAGDLKYYSDKWFAGDGWLTWCPGAGYKVNGLAVKSKYDAFYSVAFSVITMLFVAWTTAPAWGQFH